MVFFEAPHRLQVALAAMAEAFGADRRAAVCRELTKTSEEVRRGGLGELAEWAANGVKGEITVVIAGYVPQALPPVIEDLVAEVARREETGVPKKQAIVDVAKLAGIPKRDLYDAVHRG